MSDTTPRRPHDEPVIVVRKTAPANIRAAVRSNMAGSMAGILCMQQIDTSDRTAARCALVEAGFYEPSISVLLDRAIVVATMFQEHADV